MAPDRPVVSKRSGRRARARKRRASQAEGAQATALAQKPRPAPARARARRASAGAASVRPRSPWHPWPFSELLILTGAIGVVIALSSHPESHLTLIAAGIAAVAIGTLEVTLREHLAGYKSHTVLLAAIPPIALHSAVILGLVAFIRVPRWVNFPLLPLDLALFAVCFKYLRRRYRDARRERDFARGR